MSPASGATRPRPRPSRRKQSGACKKLMPNDAFKYYAVRGLQHHLPLLYLLESRLQVGRIKDMVMMLVDIESGDV
jgi:hypothetical protein